MHRARQFCLKVHRTSVTCDVMRRRRTNTRPRGRGNVEVEREVEVEVNLYNLSKDIMLSQQLTSYLPAETPSRHSAENFVALLTS